MEASSAGVAYENSPLSCLTENIYFYKLRSMPICRCCGRDLGDPKTTGCFASSIGHEDASVPPKFASSHGHSVTGLATRSEIGGINDMDKFCNESHSLLWHENHRTEDALKI
jgi:hypothetical protein